MTRSRSSPRLKPRLSEASPPSDTPPQRVVKAWFAVMTGAVM